ncbi:MAG TPA: cation diffusion facilitator family transporter [Nocardioidaceae bacterium]|nr:cation diffusion facilitator family transporter [Nocardioidaceae bacterium]
MNGGTQHHDESDHSHDLARERHHHQGHEHDTHGWWAKMKHVLVPHSHDANATIQSAEQASDHGIRAAWIGLAGMMTTALAQVVIVTVSGSIALLADTVHNLGHAATTIPLIIAFRLGRRSANGRYSYGYRRAEDLVGLFIGLIVAITAAIIIWESVDALVNPREITNLGWVFAAGVVGFLGNEIVAVYRIRAGRRIGSAALIAEGQHARADGLTSIAVVIGVIGVWLGLQRADAIIGFLIGLAILWILVSSMKTVGTRLMDGVDEGVVERLSAAAAGVVGVEGVDRVRARWSGHRIEGDASIRVSRDLDVLAAHDIADEVEHAMLHAVAHVEAIVVHVHPVDVSDGELHALSGHHASADARERYLERQAATSPS